MILKAINRGVLFVLIIFVISQVQAQERDIEELADLSLEELLNLKVITASKNAEGVFDAAGVISVVTRDQIERYNGNSLKDILERVASFNATTVNTFDKNMLAVRGDQTRNNSGHILYLINGRPTRESVEGGIATEFLSAFPVEAIERVEVIRGPGSVLYGSNAFTAVVNVITRKVEDKGNVIVSGATGIGGGYSGNLMATTKIKDVEVMFAGRVFDETPWDLSYTGFNALSQSQPVPVTTDFTMEDLSKGAILDLRYKNLRINSSYNRHHAQEYLLGAASPAVWTKSFNNIGYTIPVSGNWDLDFNATYNYSTFATGSGDNPYIKRISNDAVIEFTNNIALNDRSNLIVGGLYNYLDGRDDVYQEGLGGYFPVAELERGSIAAYSQLDYWVLENLKLIGGFQANKVKDLDFSIVPRAGVVWYPVDKINIKALYGSAFRAATVTEAALDIQGFKGNPDLDPERVQTFDFGINFLGKKAQLGLNYFSSRQIDIINPGFNGNVVMYLNQGETKFNGLEAEGKYFLNKKFQLEGALLYQENQNHEGVWENTVIPALSGKAGLSYRSENGITASVFNIIQSKPVDKYLDGVINPAADAYHILNLYASFDLNKLAKLSESHQISVFAQGDNILNKEIWLPQSAGGITVPYTGGRTLYVGVKFALR